MLSHKARTGSPEGGMSAVMSRLLDVDTVSHLAELFKMMADATRLQIISLLTGRELCVGDIASALGMSMSAVSHQLGLLRRARLVRWRREGKEVHYQLDDEHIEMLFRAGLEHVLGT